MTILPFLDVAERTGLEPLDRQFGAHPRKSVPDPLRDVLFGATVPTRSELRHYVAASELPAMRTYLIADAQAFPDWQEERLRLDLMHRCLFTGQAAGTLGHAAPWLVALAEGDDFTRRLFTCLEGFSTQSQVHHWHRPFGLIIRSRAGFDAVFQHLRRFTKLQDRDGKWYFRRFWEARHSYFWLPLLTDDLPIAARFFGRTAKAPVSVLHSISALNGPGGSMMTAIWNDDAFLDPAMAQQLPASRVQVLDKPYQTLLERATQRESLEKIVDHLVGTYPLRFAAEVLPRAQVREFALDTREDALRLGCTTELGWARIATIATHLGTGFLRDPRFGSRGLSSERIGHDSQGEKVLAIGRECAKPVAAVRERLSERQLRQDLIGMAPIDATTPAVLAMLRLIDPNCEWTWGEAALKEWALQFLTLSRPEPEAGHMAAEIALAYCCGLEFRWDRSLGYAAESGDLMAGRRDAAVTALFGKVFGTS